MMLWTTIANDRRVPERLEKGLPAPKNGDLSLEEAPWAVLRLVGVPNPLALSLASEAGTCVRSGASYKSTLKGDIYQVLPGTEGKKSNWIFIL